MHLCPKMGLSWLAGPSPTGWASPSLPVVDLLPPPMNLPAGSRYQVMRNWLRAFWPAPMPANRTERLRVVVGAFVGIGTTALICYVAGESAGGAVPWLVAPMGASAVLVFGVPASPLAQPWAVVGGNTLSALVGVACALYVPRPELAAAMSVGLAIGLMFALRCLHPPGGASALLAALSGVTDPGFALYPVLANSILLVAAGIAYNNLTRRAYPHSQGPADLSHARDPDASAFDADLDAVLARYNQVLDVSRDDLKALLQDARLRAYQRKLADLRCRDIMSTALVTVRAGTSLQDAWPLFRAHGIKALPVVDAQGCLVGIVTPADFLRSVPDRDESRFEGRLRQLQNLLGSNATNPVQRVGEIMTRKVRVCSRERHLSELIPLFGGSGHHHIPIVDEQRKLIGMVTQSDVVSALSQAASMEGTASATLASSAS